MLQMPTTAPLPPGWESKMTPEGRVYFIDHKTGRTQWEPPTAAAQAPSAPHTFAGVGTAQFGATATAGPTTAVSGGGGLPPGWEATVDPSSGKTYYLDHNTRQTHWELPAANPRAAAATSAAGGQQDYSTQWKAYYAAQRAQQVQQVQVQQQRQHAAEQQHYAPRGARKRGAPAAPSKDPPPEGYVCRLCQVAGHWIQDCPGAVSSLDKAVIVGVPPTVKDGELYCPENHPIDPKAVVRYDAHCDVCQSKPISHICTGPRRHYDLCARCYQCTLDKAGGEQAASKRARTSGPPGIAARSSVASEAYYTHGKMITTDIRKKIFDNARYKTQPCTQWKNTGSCKFGKTCVYYHGEEEKMSFRTHCEREIPKLQEKGLTEAQALAASTNSWKIQNGCGWG